MAKQQRVIPGQSTQDPSSIAAIQYNEPSGAQKNLSIGPNLVALPDGSGGYTTNATTAIRLRAGKNLAIYNNAGVVGSITLGTDAVPPVSQAPGAVQASTNGKSVGIPCPPNAWTYISTNTMTQVIASAATLLVFVIEDPTYINVEDKK